MKECKKCKQLFTLDNFYKCRSNKDGLHTRCKTCYSKIQIQNYEKNREKRLKQMREYNKENIDSLRIRKREYQQSKMANDINYKLTRNLRARLNKAVQNHYKSGSAIKDLGCSIDFLKSYLEERFQSGMTWDNYGEWHIDHIRPLAQFNLQNKLEFKKAAHFSNLQPLWAKENLQKGAS